MRAETIKAILADPDVREALILEFYSEAFSIIQSLGGFGFHDMVDITREEALQGLKKAKNNLLDTK